LSGPAAHRATLAVYVPPQPLPGRGHNGCAERH
jgi:hypothetical protein